MSPIAAGKKMVSWAFRMIDGPSLPTVTFRTASIIPRSSTVVLSVGNWGEVVGGSDDIAKVPMRRKRKKSYEQT